MLIPYNLTRSISDLEITNLLHLQCMNNSQHCIIILSWTHCQHLATMTILNHWTFLDIELWILLKLINQQPIKSDHIRKSNTKRMTIRIHCAFFYCFGFVLNVKLHLVDNTDSLHIPNLDFFLCRNQAEILGSGGVDTTSFGLWVRSERYFVECKMVLLWA